MSVLIHKSSWKKIEAELKKCDLLCSSCHSKRHYDDYERYKKYEKEILEIKEIIKTEESLS